MNFKKSKEEVISDACISASSSIHAALSHIRYNTDQRPSELIAAIEFAINTGIKDTIISIVNNIYTDEEFERDLHLRS